MAVRSRSVTFLLVAAVGLGSASCSIKSMAINKVGDALSSTTGGSFSRDDDPELVRDAIPFALKTIESLLEQAPRHKGLHLSATSGFTQYGFAFLQQEADLTEVQDLDRATHLRARAKKLYLRAVGYGMKGLAIDLPGFEAALLKDPDAALAKTKQAHVPLLYWTGAAWAAAFALDVTDSELSIRQTIIEKMMRRALVLDETWDQGSLHEFFISWEAGHASAGGSIEKAREHFAKAKALSGGRRLAPFVSVAESIAITENNKVEFEEMLNTALAIDVNAHVNQRLANLISQRRAKWLLSRIEDLFVE